MGRLHLIALICLLYFIANPANANLDSELQNAFGDMVNVTPGGSYQTQRRGVITGGSITLRNSLVAPNLISFVPPNVKGGCNGIDMFGGSFSFINGAQFTQLARSVAQAAVGYAFQLAIEGMCPTCAQVISKLQSEITKINSLMRNSCEFAKGMVDATGLKAWSDERRKEASSLNSTLGLNSDYFDSQENSTTAPAATLIANGQASKITGNVVFDSLSNSNSASWFANGDQQLLEALMSLTGTLIITPKSDNSDVQYDFRKNLLNVRNIIEGGTFTLYQCESSACLLPSGGETQTITVTGMRDRASQMVWGTGSGATGTGGIVRKMVSKNSADAFTISEQQFIQASTPGVYGVLRGLASELQSANLGADRMVDIVATELTAQVVDDMYDTVNSAVRASGKPMDSQMAEVMHDRRAEINEARRVNADSVNSVNTLIQLQKTIRESLRSPMNNKVH